ncbi:helix-turn-helix domain-containing protein [Rhodococcus sp. BP-252]|uniref:Transcriptional regulator n=1 Tax=Rhodococcoides kyotonense TaxID=398843 RepID=A0A177Y8U7_9NOCA|nr:MULTISPECIES: helix-turn-helix domain-containing protein [Rhodococcus]MBY6411830.1 helix-turn-helix domain-containing protein [Rhodococcus sp. BP-320]MBY6416542.1 helix-turn-helix domain-containing protein [Rhodococcus sp. BP-321]MBY6420652.1 helix-turn-helix domain-containing protein [Rhodococcus sp. BP-324]MBY6426566.1 helix-turn-helix domain-containing protein [Rhodococcus sp. BP-323]MBY6431565.1 helix-turn-helix domain-containing protein [Rhodococcus sp. BP-322]
MSRDSVQAIVDRFGDELGRSVVVNDPYVRMLFASRHFGDEDPVRIRAMLNRDAGSEAIGHLLASGINQWTKPGRIAGSDAIGLHSRAGVPIRWRGEVLGQILVIDADGGITDGELTRIGEVAAEIAPLMVVDRAPQDSAQSEALVAAALGLDDGRRESALAELVVQPGAVRVVTLMLHHGTDTDLTSIALRHALVAARSRSRGDALLAVDGSSGHLVYLATAMRDLDTIVAEARAMARDAADVAGRGASITAGVGAEAAGFADAWLSARQAGLAASIARRVGQDPVVAWENAGVLGVLARVPTAQWDRTAVPDELRRLAEADRSGRLLETLRAFLDHAGSGPAAAEALFIHRTTLYYRLDRIRDAIGVDLDDGTVRLNLHLGLRVADLMRAEGIEPF